VSDSAVQGVAHALAEYLDDVRAREVAARPCTYDGDDTTRAFFSRLADDLDEFVVRRADERAS
jgi:hypothetical protein